MAASDERLTRWLATHAGVADARPGPLLTGGNANVTRLIESPQGRFVLRHPPGDLVSDKAAAGIAREFTALKALHGRAPVAPPVAWCDDTTILGQPFSVTRWCEGMAITDVLPPAYPPGAEGVNAIGRAMIEAIAAVHAVDPAGLVPDGFGRPDGFVLRQIERWLAVRADTAVRDLPLLAEVGRWLRTHVPPLSRASLIHCDYHLDNCLSLRERPAIAAIIDWEMATLGDPLIDLGLCLFFWRRDPEADLGFPAIQAFSNQRDAVPRETLAALWSVRTGVATDRLAYFLVFAAWRLAAIVEGAFVLYRTGKVDSAYARGLERDVPNLLREAATLIEGGVA